MQNKRLLMHHEINLLLRPVEQKGCSSRDVCMILLAYFHGLHASELLSLQLPGLELTTEKVYIRRIKSGFSAVHPLQEEEMIAMTNWLNEGNSLNVKHFSDDP